MLLLVSLHNPYAISMMIDSQNSVHKSFLGLTLNMNQ